MTVRILVADDQAAVRAGLVLILGSAPDLEVVGEAVDGRQAVDLAATLRPDVVVLDVRMPRLDGIAATRELVDLGVPGVLILTTFDLDEYVFGALRAGAAGFLLKDAEAADLLAAVRAVARGDGVMAPAVTRRVIATFAGPPAALVDLGELTDRERDVLRCLGDGLSNAEIAARLGIAEATTKTHVSRVLAKLGLRSRVQAAIAAQSLPPPP